MPEILNQVIHWSQQNSLGWLWLCLLIPAVWILSGVLGHIVCWFLKKTIDQKLQIPSLSLSTNLKRAIHHLIFSTICFNGIHIITETQYLPILFKIWLVFSVIENLRILLFYFTDVILQKFYKEMELSYKHLTEFIKRIFRFCVYVFGILYIIQDFGFDITSILAGLGIGGVAIALAAKDTLSNIFGSIVILFDRPFLVGDWIQFDKTEGIVTDIGFRSTQIKTFYDSVISIPNSLLANTIIDNIGKRKMRRTRFTLGLTYSTPPNRIQDFVKGVQKILSTHPKVKEGFNVSFSGFSDSSLDIFINFFLKVSDWTRELKEREEIHLSIIKLAESLNVSFAFPSKSVYFENALPSKAEPRSGG